MNSVLKNTMDNLTCFYSLWYVLPRVWNLFKSLFFYFSWYKFCKFKSFKTVENILLIGISKNRGRENSASERGRDIEKDRLIRGKDEYFLPQKCNILNCYPDLHRCNYWFSIILALYKSWPGKHGKVRTQAMSSNDDMYLDSEQQCGHVLWQWVAVKKCS